MGWVEMSERELRRAEVLASVSAGRMTMTAAADLMGVTARRTGWRASLPIKALPAFATMLAGGPPIVYWGHMFDRWP
jgi:hypothetical protein